MCTEQELTFGFYKNVSQISIPKYLFINIRDIDCVNTNLVNNTFCCSLFFFRSCFTRYFEEQSNQKTSPCRNSIDTKTCMSSKTYRGPNDVETIARNYKEKLKITVTCI